MSQLLPLLFLFLTAFSRPTTAEIAVLLTPSTYLIEDLTSKINLTCSWTNGSAVDPKTAVSFSLDGEVIYDSNKPEANDPTITVLNRTAISLPARPNGIPSLSCSLSSTQSTLLTIPYLPPLTFTPTPDKFAIGTVHHAVCNVTIHPASSASSLTVNYYKDKFIIGSWVVTFGTHARWSIPSVMEGVHIENGTIIRQGYEAILYSAEIKPLSPKAHGRYRCSVKFPAPIGREVDSNVWNTHSGAFQVAPAGTLGLVVVISLILFRLF